jgi:nicotinate-nucleotide adenylyltransferase
MKNKRTGILGGTFNPVHNGHLRLAECAMEQYALNEVIFIPNNISYFKSDIPMPPANIRYEMTELAVRYHKGFTISDIELKRPGNSYTYETLESLRTERPDEELYFIVGADSVLSFEKWKNPDVISADCVILAAVREDTGAAAIKTKAEELHERFGTEIRLIGFSRFDISSTMLRERITAGDTDWCRRYMPGEVVDYILRNGLYENIM